MTGEFKEASAQAEIAVDRNRLLETVQAGACVRCGERHYSADTLTYFELLREPFAQNELIRRQVGNVYEML